MTTVMLRKIFSECRGRHSGGKGKKGTMMDIDAAVAEMNALVGANIDREYVSDHVTARMMELWDGMNGWLSTGGALPNDWQRMRGLSDDAGRAAVTARLGK